MSPYRTQSDFPVHAGLTRQIPVEPSIQELVPLSQAPSAQPEAKRRWWSRVRRTLPSHPMAASDAGQSLDS
jgi:hypothetical protein